MLLFRSLFQNRAYICCIYSREPEAFELWDFPEDGICEVHPYARVQISDDFTKDTFYSHFFNARQIIINLLGCRDVNGSVQWLDVPCPFGETGSLTTAWTENIFVNSLGNNPTLITNRPIRQRAIDSVPVNPYTLACLANHERLRRIRVERIQAIERDLYVRILQDIRDDIISDASSYDGWL